MKHVILSLLGILILGAAFSQKRVVVIGSSTAAGTGASTPSLGFVQRLAAQYTSAGHTFINLAIPGTNTYNALASSVPGKPAINADGNITAALDRNPDIILVSYPSNDVASGFSNEETINNLRSIETTALAAGKTIVFVGCQPRNFPNESQRMQLQTQNDLIQLAFPVNSINVYPNLVNATGYTIDPAVSYGDGIHVNDEGHRRIFQKVTDFNIFQSATLLPVTLTRFNVEMAGKRNVLTWETSSEINNRRFRIERSADGIHFTPLAELPGKGNSNTLSRYTYTDNKPLAGRNYYRLQQEDKDARKQYSHTIVAENNTTPSSWRAYPVPATDNLNIASTLEGPTALRITLYTQDGRTAYSLTHRAAAGYQRFTLPVSGLSAGRYFVRVETPKGSELIPFIKH